MTERSNYALTPVWDDGELILAQPRRIDSFPLETDDVSDRLQRPERFDG